MKKRILSLTISCLLIIAVAASGCSCKKAADGFIKGMDVSSVISLEQSGVVFCGKDGKPRDIFQTLSEAGVNYIRVRVWNDPYDGAGNGYGGGNCDVRKAAEIGRRAAKYGMKLLVDFHYSDFWADPSRQYVPKAWRSMTLAQKSDALYAFSVGALEKISASGADIGMVQTGNEINGGLAGESDFSGVILLLKSASRAVRDFAASKGTAIKVAVHFAPASGKDAMQRYARQLDGAGLDYDVFGISYYPCWHGGMDTIRDILSCIKDSYGKETAVLETSYPYTLEDGDGFPNIVGQSGLLRDYPATARGQENYVRAVMNTAQECGAIGIFYWEGAWIPVGSSAENNRPIWEKYGSGWASSYCSWYDPDNGGKYYGGSTWDNQAFFDHDGKPLDSLRAFH